MRHVCLSGGVDGVAVLGDPAAQVAEGHQQQLLDAGERGGGAGDVVQVDDAGAQAALGERS
ncbi:hypothetical protein DV36_01345 [Amycolatopsis mediterranei]|nr:hypothetical protein DV36_01345 [Amycolatopsis mediterranei]